MDPYVVVEIGSQKQKTKTHNSGGKQHRWEETFRFKVIKETEILIKVMDEDTFTDDLVGQVTIMLDKVKMQGKVQEWHKLQYKGKEAG